MMKYLILACTCLLIACKGGPSSDGNNISEAVNQDTAQVAKEDSSTASAIKTEDAVAPADTSDNERASSGPRCEMDNITVYTRPEYEDLWKRFFKNKLELCYLCRLDINPLIVGEGRSRFVDPELQKLEREAKTEWDYRRILMFIAILIKVDDGRFVGPTKILRVERIAAMDSTYLNFDGIICNKKHVRGGPFINCSCEDLEKSFTKRLTESLSMWKHWRATGERLWLKE